MKKYVIIGNGAAGGSGVAKIRKLDPEGEIHVFSVEKVPYYYRPKLIYYLAKEAELKKFTFHKEKWYEDNNVNLHLDTKVVSLNPEKNEIKTEDGKAFSYDVLLIAVGGNCFVPPINGSDNSRVFTVRYKSDADEILELAEKSKSVIMIGGGLLGLETGNSLRKLGLSVDVVEFFPRLLPRQLDVDGAGILEKQLSEMGFNFHLGKVSEKIEGNETLELTLKSGEALKGDFIIISAGIRPDLALAKDAGLECNKGIVVDNYLRTGAENIYAAGDVAEHNGKLYGIWPPAKEQGEIAAENMVKGNTAEYKGTLFSHKLKVVGIDLVSMGDIDVDGKLEAVVKKDEDGYIYKKAVISDGKVVGCIMLGNIEGEALVARAIKEGQPFDEVKKFFL